MQFFPTELRQFDKWYGTLPKTMRKALFPACFALFRFLFDYTIRRPDISFEEKNKYLTDLFYGRGYMFTNTQENMLNEMYRGFLNRNYTSFLHTTSKLHKATVHLTPWMDRLLRMHLISFPNRILTYVFSVHVKVNTNQIIKNTETNDKDNNDNGDVNINEKKRTTKVLQYMNKEKIKQN